MVGKSGSCFPKEFWITFPSEEIRHQLTRFKRVEFRTHEIIATVEKTSMKSDVEGVLETVFWVKISGICLAAAYISELCNFVMYVMKCGFDLCRKKIQGSLICKKKKEQVVREHGYLAGDSDQVDIMTLGKPGPARVRIGVRDSSLVKGETLVFFNGQAHRLTWFIDTPGKDKAMNNSANPEMENDRDAEGGEEEDSPRTDPGIAELAKKLEGKENLSNKEKGSTSQQGRKVQGGDCNVSESPESKPGDSMELDPATIDSQEESVDYELDPLEQENLRWKLLTKTLKREQKSFLMCSTLTPLQFLCHQIRKTWTGCQILQTRRSRVQTS